MSYLTVYLHFSLRSILRRPVLVATR